jgi:segregation and condensation protein B
MEELRKLIKIARNKEEVKRVAEAALFMAPSTLSVSELQKLTGVEDKNAMIVILNELSKEYAERGSSIVVEVDEQLASCQMYVKPAYHHKVKHLAVASELSRGAQRTLALIAIKEPIKQSTVIKYRNTKAYEHLKELVEKGYITKEPAGKTYIIRTTRKFREQFNEVQQIKLPF